MNLEVDVERLLLAEKAVRAELLAERSSGGHWTGHVGSSPVATAAAVSALVASHRQDSDDVLREGATGGADVIEQLVQSDLSELLLESVHWLARRQNTDGGWGDCDGAESNIAATMLVQAAFRLTGIPARYADLMVRADEYVEAQGGTNGLRRSIGQERTYLAPVLATCAVADMVPWRQVPTLPFEWLALPGQWRPELTTASSRFMSPIVLAVGLAKFQNDPPHNPVTRLMRRGLRRKALVCLERLQATDDSFLASPLVTALVVMSLSSMGCQEHTIVERGVEYLLSSVRADASWAVAGNLSTLNTSLAIQALLSPRVEIGHSAWEPSSARTSTAEWEETATVNDTISEHAAVHAGGDAPEHSAEFDRGSIEWLLKSQHTSVSRLTNAPAGGWADSDAPGAEPNTIATAEALVALSHAKRLGAVPYGQIDRPVTAGVKWILEMQNDDGGWPTFCRDEGSQRYGASTVDATAAVLRALAAWPLSQASVATRIDEAIERGFDFLETQQRDDGSFVAGWFGNERQPENENPVLGTAQVLVACAQSERVDSPMAERAAEWLVVAQHTSGGWGPPRAPIDYSDRERSTGHPTWRENEALAKFCSVEETAAATAALLAVAKIRPKFERNISRGLAWLTNTVEQDGQRRPAIIGLSLAKIWYYERLYPITFAAGALSQAAGVLSPEGPIVVPAR